MVASRDRRYSRPDRSRRSALRAIVQALQQVAEGLGEFATGLPGRISGTYEKSVRHLPYAIAYALTDADKAITILRIVPKPADR